jgi:hypothetical protein
MVPVLRFSITLRACTTPEHSLRMVVSGYGHGVVQESRSRFAKAAASPASVDVIEALRLSDYLILQSFARRVVPCSGRDGSHGMPISTTTLPRAVRCGLECQNRGGGHRSGSGSRRRRSWRRMDRDNNSEDGYLDDGAAGLRPILSTAAIEEVSGRNASSIGTAGAHAAPSGRTCVLRATRRRPLPAC